MNRETLEKLIKNPHFRLSPRQLALLEEYRREDLNVKHDTQFQKHKPTMEDEDGRRAAHRSKMPIPTPKQD